MFTEYLEKNADSMQIGCTLSILSKQILACLWTICSK